MTATRQQVFVAMYRQHRKDLKLFLSNDGRNPLTESLRLAILEWGRYYVYPMYWSLLLIRDEHMAEIESLDASWLRDPWAFREMLMAGIREVLKGSKIKMYSWMIRGEYDSERDRLHIRVYRKGKKGDGSVIQTSYSAFVPEGATWGQLLDRVFAAGDDFGKLITELNSRA